MKSVTLSQIFSPSQCIEIAKLIDGKMDDIDRVDRLKEYFGHHREMLEDQGIVPEYLAYAVVYTATTGKTISKPNELLQHWSEKVAGASPASNPKKPRRRRSKQ